MTHTNKHKRYNSFPGEHRSESPKLHGKGGVSVKKGSSKALNRMQNLDIDGLDREKKEYIHDEIKKFRQQHKVGNYLTNKCLNASIVPSRCI